MQKVYIDGSCIGNPGPGGWSVVFVEKKKGVKNISGGDKQTTNNRMELMAAISALKITNKEVEIVTDSMYVKNGIETWIKGWKLKNWTTSAKTPVKNMDLWKELDKLAEKKSVKWSWVKGHSGNVYNEKADKLAKMQAQMHSLEKCY